MSRKRPFAVRLLLTLAGAAGGIVLLGLGGVLVCSTYPTHKPKSPIDVCAAESGYEFPDKPAVDDFTEARWWGSADYTPDGGVPDAGKLMPYASPTPAVETIPNGPLCGKYAKAGVFVASHNNDWGCIFGNWEVESRTKTDASAWEGISFWARAPNRTGCDPASTSGCGTSKGFTILLNDSNTISAVADHNCRDYGVDGGSVAGLPSSVATINDPSTGTPIVGSSSVRASNPDECGNEYSAVVQLTSDWQLYTIPFSQFQQQATPNRVPNSVFQAGDVPGNGLLRDSLRRIGFRFPKEAEMELWMTDLTFYRTRAQ
jgi:hypothetical protein